MIRTNLSTRPFYNERAVTLWLVVVTVVVAAATMFNVASVRISSGSNTELSRQASQDEARAAEARRTAVGLRSSIDAKLMDVASAEARQANDLIDRRTFSWTELFNRFETTLPDDVRITSVSPALDQQRRIVLTVAVLARTVDDVNQFMERLDSTGVFQELRSTQERTNDDDQIQSVLETVYLPTHPAEEPPAPASGRGNTRLGRP
jgi:Tfp pilus assembly protein PilN